MRLDPAAIEGAHVVAGVEHRDDRGSFTRVWDASSSAGPALVLLAISWNPQRGTLRGLHWQESPAGETKLIRCTRGRVFDVAVDVRAESSTYLSWIGVELAAGDNLALHLGEGLAHGFLTLEDDTEVQYLMTSNYEPARARGMRYDDPAIGVAWPESVTVISDRDRTFPLTVP